MEIVNRLWTFATYF